MSAWKSAGLSYLQYITHATTALRNCVKPNLLTKYLPREDISFKQQVFENGVSKGGRVALRSMPSDRIRKDGTIAPASEVKSQ